MRFDVVTIGGGFSGLVTACRAAQLGQRVAVLEQGNDERYLCASRWTNGVINVMGSSILSDPGRLEDAIINGSAEAARPDVARAVAQNGKRTLEWLGAQGGRFVQRMPDKDQPAHQVLAPPRRLQAGLDWEGHGGDVTMRLLEAQIKERGGEILRGTKAEALIVATGACTGVEAIRDGERIRIEAQAVVIADGGFPANRQMLARYITPHPDRVLCRAWTGSQGDGIRMAEAAGAAIGGFGKFYGHVHHKDAMTNNRLWPYPHCDAAAEISILIDPSGQRFTDEGLGGVCMANAIAQLADPLSSHLIMDETIWQNEPKISLLPPINPTMPNAGGKLITAPDLASLATKIDVPAAAFTATVAAYNDAVASGNFAALPVPRSVRKHKPMPIAKTPFHAVPLCAGITGTMGGVVIDANAQAQTPAGVPFPGLYAVGTPVAGLEGGPRAGYVGGLSKAFVLGLIAAEHIAAH
ncbi:MAG TPA: FAD-dependent oxidoreductase [Stellaceae bacterium]|nr:FAD-dependent oxidoreductase [Stellaceae bacterium]